MRVTLSTNTALPADLVLAAENPWEAVLLRIWGNEKRPLMIKSHGGNIEHNQISMLIGFREEKQSQGDREEKPSIGEKKKDISPGTDDRMAVKCAAATGNMDGAAAGRFYIMLMKAGVPEDVAEKMAVAYARGIGG